MFIYNSGLSREASVADLYAEDGQALRSVLELWEIPLPSLSLTKIAFAGRIIRWGSRWPRRGRPLGGRSPEFYGIVSFGTMPLHPGTNFTFGLSPSISFPPKLLSSQKGQAKGKKTPIMLAYMFDSQYFASWNN